MPKPFFFEAKSDQEVDIHIYGEIGWDESYWDDGTNNVAYALVSLIKRLDKSYSRINVHINSPGGYIEDGLAIYNTLKSANADIHTYNNGLVASMASIIMLGGTTHFPKTSIYHLHSASTVTRGNIQDHEEQIESLKVFESALQNAIADKSGMSIEEIQAKWFDGREHYMTAEQAQEFGFVDFLEDEAIEPPAAKNQLEKMDFKQIIELYKEEKELQPDKKSILNTLKNKFLSKSNPNKDMEKIVFKAKLTFLLALVGLSEFVLNASNKVELDINDAFKINDFMDEQKGEIDTLKQEKLALEEKAVQDKAKIEELQAKVDGTSGDGGANPKGGDNSKGGDDKPADELDAETSKALADYNKKQA